MTPRYLGEPASERWFRISCVFLIVLSLGCFAVPIWMAITVLLEWWQS